MCTNKDTIEVNIDDFDYKIVVARYEEDIEWLKPLSEHCKIYNKGKTFWRSEEWDIHRLDNVGRESHTYLTYILENYDNLPEVIAFTQGYIKDHTDCIIEQGKIDYPYDSVQFLKRMIIDALHFGISHNYLKHPYHDWFDKAYLFKIHNFKGITQDSSMTFGKWFGTNVGPDFPLSEDFKVYLGAVFAVKRECILVRSREYYEGILQQLQTPNPEIGHFMERSWYYIFNQQYAMASDVQTGLLSRNAGNALIKRRKFLVVLYGPCFDKENKIDYRITKENIKEYVLEDLVKYYDVQVMLVTNTVDDEVKGSVKQTFQASQVYYIPTKQGQTSPSIQEYFTLAIDKVYNMGGVFDYIICIRFNMLFFEPVTSQHIDIDNFSGTSYGLYIFPFLSLSNIRYRLMRKLDFTNMIKVDTDFYQLIYNKTKPFIPYLDRVQTQNGRMVPARGSFQMRGFVRY
jgi:hypothetical protein